MMTKVFRVFENDALVSKTVCQFVVEKANEAIRLRNQFCIGLSGNALQADKICLWLSDIWLI